jgi:Protein of unknown function (DUF1566)
VKKLIGMLVLFAVIMSIAGSSYAQTSVQRAKISAPLSVCFPKALTYSLYKSGDFFIFDGQNTILASGNGDISDVDNLLITYIKGAKTYTVGEAGQAGIVFHDKKHWNCGKDGSLIRYLESDKEDQSGFFGIPYYTWEDAKKKCNGSDKGGHTDWFLPKIDELGEMYVLRDKIGGFETKAENLPWYWSSSENMDGNARYQSFYDGNLDASRKDNTSFNRVRCIRAL